ncbi:ABATE domain-containing protein [Rugamonas sp.]|uniref:CGNR zinc finger domain-containing protein n=1 Tax=Rugamonas sp. TaxID=1926287 RepID=UPI0025DDE494|nr:ABATE domain-containing protein [Rugamonas sp.]
MTDNASTSPEFIADHPALNLLNTVAMANGAPTDSWRSDADVLLWLERAGFVAQGMTGRDPVPRLLDVARGFRELFRKLVAERKAGQRLDLSAFNAYLAQSSRHLELLEDAGGALALQARYDAGNAKKLIGPLVEAAAELLADGDFSLIKHCENPDCILIFLDKTKSHRRRWCRMAVCGNRHKVASFRQRQQDSNG